MTILDSKYEFLSPAILGVEFRNRNCAFKAISYAAQVGYSRHRSTFFRKMSSPQTVPSITDRLTNWATNNKPTPAEDGIEIYNNKDMDKALHDDVDKYIGTVGIQCSL
jgi:hypothetical protein